MSRTKWAVVLAVVVGGGFAFLATLLITVVFPQEDTIVPPGSYDPGLYTPFTHAPTYSKRPAHPFSIYRPPGYEGK